MKINYPPLNRTVSIILLFVCVTNAFALDYTISFTGSGSSVDSVRVQNITKGTNIKVPSGQVLFLKDVLTNVNDLSDSGQKISLFPNPVTDISILSFYALISGNININIADVTGKNIFSENRKAETGKNIFKVSLPQGIFFINISGAGINYTQKAVSYSKNILEPVVSGISNQAGNIQKSNKAAGVTMLFNDGDVLLYNASSGNNSTILSDSPSDSKTVDFEFAECKDADNNYYCTIKIGDQLWMAANLKTTKYRNGEDIPNVSDANDWKYLYSPGWCDHSNDPNNGHIYGKLYNYYAVSDSRNIAPEGWHVATKDEWAAMINHVATHWSFLESETKALASRDGWRASTIENTPGYQPLLNNYSGFTAKPGGDRGGFFNGTFFNLSEVAFWWTATDFGNISDAYYMYFAFDVYTTIISNGKKQYGFSVRCVKD